MKDKPMFEGFLRVYAEVDGYGEALEVARELLNCIQQHIPVDKLQVEPYWKIPEYYGVVLFFEGEELGSKFNTLLDSFASGWEPVTKHLDFQDAIWNSSEASRFINPLVRWAHLDVSLVARGEQQMGQS